MQITYVVDVTINNMKIILECWVNGYSHKFDIHTNEWVYDEISLKDWEEENIVYNCERIPKYDKGNSL